MTGQVEWWADATTSTEMTEAQLRQFADALICPWCRRGPFKLLSGHTNRAHGIDARDLRNRLGYARRVSLCDTSLSAFRSGKARVEGNLVGPTGDYNTPGELDHGRGAPPCEVRA